MPKGLEGCRKWCLDNSQYGGLNLNQRGAKEIITRLVKFLRSTEPSASRPGKLVRAFYGRRQTDTKPLQVVGLPPVNGHAFLSEPGTSIHSPYRRWINETPPEVISYETFRGFLQKF